MTWQMRAVGTYLKATRKRRYLTVSAAERAIAEPKGPSSPPASLTRRFRVTTRSVDGFDVHVVNATDRAATVFYLHGGGYVGEIDRRHWALVADVASAVGVEVCVPIYGLAPQYHAKDAIGLMHKLLRDASSRGPTYLMGDSAGGGLALAATLSWIRAGGPPPIGLTLIAPWLDVGLCNPAVAAIEPRDPWLSTVGLAVCGRIWAGDMSLDDPRVSPVFADFSAIPPIDLYVGDRDITLADCRALRDKVPSGRMVYHEEPGALHVYPLLPVPEGKLARQQVVAHVKSVLATL